MIRPVRWFRAQSRGRQWRLVGLVVATVLVISVLGLVTAGVASLAAKRDAEQAVAALRDKDIDAARGHADSAGWKASYARGAAGWWGADVLRVVPGVGGAVRDTQHLTTALDELTEALDGGLEIAPLLIGEDARLMLGGGSVDMDTLDELSERVPELGPHLHAARDALAEVDGDAPLVGSRIASAADAAAAQVDPATDSYDAVEPLVAALPELFGAGRTKRYLLALLNPAEQRFSGGAALSFKVLEYDDGELARDQGVNTMGDQAITTPRTWRRVPQNPFHLIGQSKRVTTATTAPTWEISGLELARGWQAARGGRVDGVVALDVMAIQRLLAFTGPIDAVGFGTLTQDNLVQQLAGSYDDYTDYEIFEQRKLGEAELMGAFQERLLDTDDALGVARTLGDAARGGHVAIFMRNNPAQSAIEALGLDGDLSDTDHDYLGVFNQSLNGAKSDYWQRRSVTSDVRLAADGSAQVRVEIDIFNDSPPVVVADPRLAAYVQRDNVMSLGVFLPRGVDDVDVTLDGAPVQTGVADYYGRPFTRTDVTFAPQQRRTMVVEYAVPSAATPEGDGRLTYRLDVDPHALVDPQATSVTVHWPEGYRPASLPDGWTASAGSATIATEALDTTWSWEVPLRRGGGS